jgi:MFS transporter, AAHS family, 4-hydroxybenzoate transporter
MMASDSPTRPAGREMPLDALPFSSFQFWSVMLAASVVVLDGLDNQMLGIAAPSLIKDWGIARESLGMVFALGFVGMIFGNLISGWLGDRFGRRSALIFGVIVFGLATLLTGFASNIEQIAILRTLAGVGLGGVPGTAAALISELTPARFRSVAVTFGAVCVAIGGILGGMTATLILPHLDWRWLFYIGGTVPLVSAVAVAALLPESPSFLASRPQRAAELRRFLARMRYPGSDAEFREALHESAQEKAEHVPTSALLAPALRRDTLALCVALFTGLFMIYLMYNWVPTLLFSNAFPLAVTSAGLTSFNIGGVIGAILASMTMVRLGSRQVLIPLALLGAAVCVVLALLPTAGAQNKTSMLAALCALGLSASAVQSAVFAVGAHAFPAAVRARGMGLIGAAGRIGAIASALAGAMLTGYGNPGFFGALAALMLINAASLALVRGHVPKLRAQQRPLAYSAAQTTR